MAAKSATPAAGESAPFIPPAPASRRLAAGAEVQPGGGVHFRVWAPRRARVEVVLDPAPQGPSRPASRVALDREAGGYFSGYLPDAPAGTRYRFRLDNLPMLYPDPASRYQPEGPVGPSEVVDPGAYAWRDDAWLGAALAGQVAYEMHVGTFTPEGTWAAATAELAELASAGISLIEVMPVAEFPGRFGWGYDGVDLFAPSHLYGAPDDFRRFVDEAHGHKMAVILDVVYNHLGPTGNYLRVFADDYFSRRHSTEWGEAINFDGPNHGPVRDFFLDNAAYWTDEFHLDGLRLDATQAIFDDSHEHILAAVAARVRQAAAGRQTIVVAENEPQEVRHVRPPAEGGFGLDGIWNDDFHHAARVAMTGRNEYYYRDYQGSCQELISALKWGYLYQGQFNERQQKRRGTPSWMVPAWSFMLFLDNHDQVANSGLGLRCHGLSSPGRYRAMTALLLLAPGTPMLFQGQEFAASAPFLYFADHEPGVADMVRRGRIAGLRQFESLAGPDTRESLGDPCDIRAFERSKLDLSERKKHSQAYDLHRDLIRLRREDAVFSRQRSDWLHGAALAPEAFLLRYLTETGDDRLLLVNLGRDFVYSPAAEPLIAPPPGADWRLLWSSENPRYGGSGTAPIDTLHWRLQGHAAIVLHAQPIGQRVAAAAPMD